MERGMNEWMNVEWGIERLMDGRVDEWIDK